MQRRATKVNVTGQWEFLTPQNLCAMFTRVSMIKAGYITSKTGPKNLAIPEKPKVDTKKPIAKVIKIDA